VRLGEVALEGRGRDPLDREGDHELPGSSERIAIAPDDRAAVLLDAGGEARDGRRSLFLADLRGREAP
jgi:hypothetical protein